MKKKFGGVGEYVQISRYNWVFKVSIVMGTGEQYCEEVGDVDRFMA